MGCGVSAPPERCDTSSQRPPATTSKYLSATVADAGARTAPTCTPDDGGPTCVTQFLWEQSLAPDRVAARVAAQEYLHRVKAAHGTVDIVEEFTLPRAHIRSTATPLWHLVNFMTLERRPTGSNTFIHPVAETLLSLGADPLFATGRWDYDEGVTALHLCAFFGRADLLLGLLARWPPPTGIAPINFQTHPHGDAALHVAIANGQIGVANALLDQVDSVDVHMANSTGATPLRLAVQGGYARLAERLLSRGADPNAVHPDGTHLTHVLALTVDLRHHWGDLLPTLLSHGMSPNPVAEIEGVRCNTDMELMAVFARQGCDAHVHTLLQEGAPVHPSALLMACLRGNAPLFADLMDYGGDLYAHTDVVLRGLGVAKPYADPRIAHTVLSYPGLFADALLDDVVGLFTNLEHDAAGRVAAVCIALGDVGAMPPPPDQGGGCEALCTTLMHASAKLEWFSAAAVFVGAVGSHYQLPL